MTMKKKKQRLCEDNLRHNEYYGMQNTIDNLYQASLNGEVFTDLMSVILQRENILLAYRNIKKNTGSKTSGTDNLTIEDIGRCSPDEVVEKVRFIINGSEHGYRPKPVRRTDVYSHILDDDRRKNAELFEEAFYEKKNLDPQMHVQQENNNATVADEIDPELLAKVLANPEMRALLNSLAKTMK